MRLYLLVLAVAVAGCDASPSPLAPTRVPQPPQASPAPPPQAGPPPAGDQLTGLVYDSAYRPLAGARVEVVNGPHAGMTATTDGGGRFWLTGQFDDATQFRATKDGHIAATTTRGPRCERCNPNWWIYFTLGLTAPPVDIAGAYTLTVIADSACVNFPESARRQTYSAVVTLAAPAPNYPDNTRFDVTVGGSPFLDGYNRFEIYVAGNYLAGWLGDLHGTPGLVAQVAPKVYMAFGGAFDATRAAGSGSEISAAFDGFIEQCASASEMGADYACRPDDVTAHAQCTSRNHRLILTPR